MTVLEALLAQFMFATLRYLPVMAIPALSPLAWAPGMVRVTVTLAMAAMTVLSAPSLAMQPAWQQPVGLVFASLSELMIGLTFALALVLPQAALGMSARVADQQAGLSAADLFNPAGEHEPESMLGTVLMLGATVLFFAANLHLVLFQALATSVRALPLGAIGLHLNLEGFLGMLGSAFVLGLAVMTPVILGLFAVDVGVAYATRSMPQANVYFLALPLKIGITLLLLAMTLRFAPSLIGRLYQDAFARLPSVLGA